MHKKYTNEVQFIFVYLREAHPAEEGKRGGQPALGGGGFGAVPQPKTEEERHKVAAECVKGLKLSMPTVVDDMKDSTRTAYATGADRLYLIDKAGKVAFRSEPPGPMGFKSEKMEEAIKALLEKNPSSEK